jgi:hypothetical protein
MEKNKDWPLSKILSLRIGVASKTCMVYQSNLSFRTAGPFHDTPVRTYVFGSPQSASINQIEILSNNQNMADLPAPTPNQRSRMCTDECKN